MNSVVLSNQDLQLEILPMTDSFLASSFVDIESEPGY